MVKDLVRPSGRPPKRLSTQCTKNGSKHTGGRVLTCSSIVRDRCCPDAVVFALSPNVEAVLDLDRATNVFGVGFDSSGPCDCGSPTVIAKSWFNTFTADDPYAVPPAVDVHELQLGSGHVD